MSDKATKRKARDRAIAMHGSRVYVPKCPGCGESMHAFNSVTTQTQPTRRVETYFNCPNFGDRCPWRITVAGPGQCLE